MPRTLSENDIQEFRRDLCAVAERMFALHGYEGVTLRGLAAELGCSPMTPYRYFENKEAIYEAVRESAFERFGDAVEKTAAAHACPIERFRALAFTYLDFARQEPDAYRVMFLREHPDRDGPPGPVHGWHSLVETIEQAVAIGRMEGDPMTLAHLAWISLHGLVSLELSGRFMLGRTRDDLLLPSIEHFLRGAGAPPTPPHTGDPT